MSHLIIFLLFLVELFGLLWLILIFFSGIFSVISGAPYVPMEKRKIEELLSFGGLNNNDIFYDLGSGDGRVLTVAARKFHVAEAIGYEVAPWPYWKSRWRLYRLGLKNITARNQNFFNSNLAEATFVYAYLFPGLMEKLPPKFTLELPVGARILSPSFPIDTVKYPQLQLKKTEKIGNITAYLYQKI